MRQDLVRQAARENWEAERREWANQGIEELGWDDLPADAKVFLMRSAEIPVAVACRESDAEIANLRAEVDRLQKIAAAATPKPLDDAAPKDRVLIGVERPPCEEKTYYNMVRWVEEKQDWMIPRGWNFDKQKYEFARSGVSHYLDPLELPGLPYWEGEDEEEEQADE